MKRTESFRYRRYVNYHVERYYASKFYDERHILLIRENPDFDEIEFIYQEFEKYIDKLELKEARFLNGVSIYAYLHYLREIYSCRINSRQRQKLKFENISKGARYKNLEIIKGLKNWPKKTKEL